MHLYSSYCEITWKRVAKVYYYLFKITLKTEASNLKEKYDEIIGISRDKITDGNYRHALEYNKRVWPA